MVRIKTPVYSGKLNTEEEIHTYFSESQLLEDFADFSKLFGSDSIVDLGEGNYVLYDGVDFLYVEKAGDTVEVI